MTRARPLPPDERRRALIDATKPLLVAQGATVSTRQIAEAAGVAEGTIFRVFSSKDDLIASCLEDVLSHAELSRDLADLPSDADLPASVTHLVTVVTEHVRDARALFLAFRHRDHSHEGLARDQAGPGASDRCRRPDPREIHTRVVDAVAEVLQRHAPALRVEPRLAASALVATAYGSWHWAAEDAPDPGTIADLLLHGISKES